MAKRSHVPRFGDWRENVQYTAFFDDARKDKGGHQLINPNDPEQNPSAFNYEQKNVEKSRKPNPTINTTSNENVDGARVAARNKMPDRNFLESSSDRNYHSDNKFSHRGKNSRSISETYPLPSQSHPAINPATSSHAGTQHHRVASVPKFGAWDESNPQSGDRFTLIFNNVKEQKQHAATNFPPVSHEPIDQPKRNQKKKRTTKSKAWTCFFL